AGYELATWRRLVCVARKLTSCGAGTPVVSRVVKSALTTLLLRVNSGARAAICAPNRGTPTRGRRAASARPGWSADRRAAIAAPAAPGVAPLGTRVGFAVKKPVQSPTLSAARSAVEPGGLFARGAKFVPRMDVASFSS